MTDSNGTHNMKDGSRHWEITEDETVYRGFYKINKIDFNHALFKGGNSGPVDREQFIRGNVVGVLVHDPALDKVALIEQFRIGARHHKSEPWLIEIIAGMVEAGEKPIEVATREAYEEAGLTLSNVSQFAHYLASPGASTEEVFLFYAHADLSGASGVFGLEEEGEDILLHVVDANEAIQKMESGEICNALSIIALQWFKIDRLQKTQ